MLDEAAKYYEQRQYDKAIELAKGTLEEGNTPLEVGLLLCRSYLAQGDFKNALETAKNLIKQGHQDKTLQAIVSSYESHLSHLERGMQQIREGQHSSDDINALKESSWKLIENKAFYAALSQLRLLAEARKAKTTNILWIGQYLKEIFFADEAQDLRPKFDKLLLDEILFYYLKSCKLHEKGYTIVREAVKALK
ncbi:MAG: hypothetical protein OHK0038_09120 [Flammeovirgaceae bacterium]